MLAAEITAESECPVYGCALAVGDHEPVDPAGWADSEPDSLWHFDGVDGHWPAPLISLPPEPQEPLPFYAPAEERNQRGHRERKLRWARPHWRATVEDTIFEHTMLGVSEIPFDGDSRPPREVAQQAQSLPERG